MEQDRFKSREKHEWQFSFQGTAEEYFRIWIVNVLLSIVSLGIYSAWAKVRSNQYFYGNTYLDGSAFEYSAEPVNILKGRLIAVVLFGSVYLSYLFLPALVPLFLLVLGCIAPIVLVMAVSFQARYSAWRGIHFGFRRDFKTAYLIFIMPILVLVAYTYMQTLIGFADVGGGDESGALPENIQQYFYWVLGLSLIILAMFPWWIKLYYSFVLNRLRLGRTNFDLAVSGGNFYAIYLGIIGISILMAFPSIVLLFLLVGLIDSVWQDNLNQYLVPVLSFIVLFPMYAFLYAWIQCKRINLVFSNLKLDQVSISSRLGVGRMTSLYITNTLAIICSLGLAIPWVKVRLARYRAECTSASVRDEEVFTAAMEQDKQSGAEEIMDMFDYDLGL